MSEEIIINGNYAKVKIESAMNLVESSSPGFAERAARRVIGDTSDDIWCVGDDTSKDDEVVAACLLKVFAIHREETS